MSHPLEMVGRFGGVPDNCPGRDFRKPHLPKLLAAVPNACDVRLEEIQDLSNRISYRHGRCMYARFIILARVQEPEACARRNDLGKQGVADTSIYHTLAFTDLCARGYTVSSTLERHMREMKAVRLKVSKRNLGFGAS